MNMGLKHKLILTFLTVQIVLTTCAGYYQYKQQWPLLESQSVENHKNIARQLNNIISLSIEGNNYANIYLPTFVDRLKSMSSLIYLEVNGVSERSNKYQFAYHKALGETWRNYYPANYSASLDERIEKLSTALLNKNIDTVKVNFLLHRIEEEKLKYTQNLKQKKALSQLNLPFIKNTPAIQKNWMLTFSIPSTNNKGGNINFIFDVSPLKQLQDTLLRSLLLESFFTLSITSLLIILAIQWFIHPIEQLTKHLSHDIQAIDIDNIPAITTNNEIGDLARKFKVLVSNTSQHIRFIEELSTLDTLTNLLNRRHFDKIANDLLLRAKQHDLVFSLLFIDIDNFKKYNDNYGHNEGDVALQKVAATLLNTVNKDDDYCFRFGGEEFLVVLINKTHEQACKVAKSICTSIEDENIEHLFNQTHNKLTVSIGACSIIEHNDNVKIKDILKNADNALYKAKGSGKNKVCCTVI